MCFPQIYIFFHRSMVCFKAMNLHTIYVKGMSKMFYWLQKKQVLIRLQHHFITLLKIILVFIIVLVDPEKSLYST